jgi:hypothetical protein
VNDITVGTRDQSLQAIGGEIRLVREDSGSVRAGFITLAIHDGSLIRREVNTGRFEL